LLPQAVGLLGFWFLFLLLFCVHLFRNEAIHTDSNGKIWYHKFFTRDRLALAIDPLVLSLSYYLAYFLRFRSAVAQQELVMFFHSWPLLLTIKFTSLWWFRVYRGSWWRSSIGDVHRLAKAVLTGEVITLLALTAIFRFEGYSRLVFALDAVLSWILLLTVRNSFSLFKNSIDVWRPPTRRARRVFVLGTSERAELAIRFLRDSSIECAGLIDTNGGSDLGRRVWGMQVIGKIDDLGRHSRQLGVSEVVQPDNESLPLSQEDFSRFCRHRRLQLTRLGLFPASQVRDPQHKNAA
jgi:FlaA1/EpsC-like NDP-sugar epimerase